MLRKRRAFRTFERAAAEFGRWRVLKPTVQRKRRKRRVHCGEGTELKIVPVGLEE